MIRGGLKKTTTLASIPSSCGANVEDHDAQSKQQLNAMTPAEDHVVSATSPFHDEISDRADKHKTPVTIGPHLRRRKGTRQGT